MCWSPLESVHSPLAQISDADEPLIASRLEILPFLGRVARAIVAPFHMLMTAVYDEVDPFWISPAAQTLSGPKLVTAFSPTPTPPLLTTVQLAPPVQCSQSDPRVGPLS